MRNVYLIQPSGMLDSSVYLPYSVGCIAAYSFSKEEIKVNYELQDFIFMKEPINEVIKKIENPYVIGFSCYMWNIDYNLSLAKAVKNNWPEAVVVFGGPQIPDSVEYLEKYHFIDILIHGEGEQPFYMVLKESMNNPDFSSIPGISYRDIGKIKKNDKVAPPKLNDMPSPYITGMFDKIINDPKYKNISFDAILETNRGCPYGCIYCYFSRGNKNMRKFSLERIRKDIEWIAQHKISYCVCADSNFGIFERDEAIAEYVIEMKNKYGYPRRFETASAKNKDELIFRINSKLENAGLNRGISVALQSASPDTLEIIGRKNMSFEKYTEQIKKYRDNHMDTYTDMILGLPGETLDSFCRGIFNVIEAGQHYSVIVYRCEVFPNTAIYTDEMRRKYKIKTIRSQLCQNHSKVSKDLSFASRSEIVVETNTMSVDEWKVAQEVAMCAQTLHSMGLLRFFGVYLRKAKNIPYYNFYMDLYRWIKSESKVVNRLMAKVCEKVDPFLRHESNLFFADDRFGDIYWAFDEGFFLCCVAELEDFYKEIKGFLKQYFDDEVLFEDLFNYQKEMIALPGKSEKEIKTLYDWQNYYEHIFDSSFTLPELKATVLKVQKSATSNWEDYGREIIWYGKRSGRTVNMVIDCIR